LRVGERLKEVEVMWRGWRMLVWLVERWREERRKRKIRRVAGLREERRKRREGSQVLLKGNSTDDLDDST